MLDEEVVEYTTQPHGFFSSLGRLDAAAGAQELAARALRTTFAALNEK